MTHSQTQGADGAGTSLDDRLRAAGMFTVPEMMGETPLTRWQTHAAMTSLDAFEWWLDAQVRQYLTMKAQYEIGDKPKDDELYEWVLAHSGAFHVIRTNFRAAKAATPAPAATPGVPDSVRALSEAFAETACCASCTTPMDCYQGKPCRLEPVGSGSGVVDHEFKSHPDVFWPAARGEKTFEYRRDDRGGYEVGQTVRLRCYDLTRGYHDTAPLDRRVTNILRGGEFELPMGYCILSLAPLAAQPAGQSTDDGTDRCEVCNKPLIAGQRVMQDVELGTVHAACCGPEREAYVKDVETGEPLGPNDPIPQGYVYEPGPSRPVVVCNGDPAGQSAGQAGDAGADARTVLTEACKPWEHYTGEPPDDGSPLSGVFVAGMVYTERLLAKLLDVTHYEGGDGSEDFDSDAAQTLRNILAGAGLWDADENCAVKPAPDSTRTGAAETEELREEVAYWRRDLSARLCSLTALYKAALDRGESDRAADLANAIRPALASYHNAEDGEWHERCELCGEFVRDGEPRAAWEDVSGHARCLSEDGKGHVDPHGDEDLARQVEAAQAALDAPWPEAALAARPEAPSDAGWSFDMEAAPRDGTVILLWRKEWGEPSAAYWGLAPMADGAGIATKRHPWVFLDSTNGVNGYEDGGHGPMAWHPMLDAPTPPSDPAPSGQAEG